MEKTPFVGALHRDVHGTGDFGGERSRGRARDHECDLGRTSGGEHQ